MFRIPRIVGLLPLSGLLIVIGIAESAQVSYDLYLKIDTPG